MSAANPAAPRSSRLGTFANLGAVLLVVVLIIPLALHATQPPPPTVAEFSPPVKQITNPPREQSGLVGKQGGGAGAGGAYSPTPTPASSGAPGVTYDTRTGLPCAGGDPPRQIEDPQSPPCISFWDNSHGNGGSTSQGVDSNNITVYAWDYNWTDTAKYTWMTDLVKFFNERMQFYGRHLNVVFANAQNPARACPGDTTTAQQQAQQDATYVISFKPFAATSYCPEDGVEVPYYQDLAQAGVISVIGQNMDASDSWYNQYDPFVWNVQPGTDVMEHYMAQYACNALKGNATFAGDASYKVTPRKFGLVYTTFNGGGYPDYQPMLNQLTGCGINVASSDIQVMAVENQNKYVSQVAQLKGDGVTTVMCLCDVGYLGSFMDNAQSASYDPEWYVSSYYQMESEQHTQLLWPASEANSAFGISFMNKRQALNITPWYYECKQAAPSECNDDVLDSTQQYYSALLMLASGIQMAGPHLTPQSFKNGLQNTVFPDPNAGQAPFWQAGVSFANDHAFNQDATLIWYSTQNTSAENGLPGAWCYANHGERYTLADLPKSTAMLFGTSSCQ